MSTQIWRELGVDASEGSRRGAPSPNPKPLFDFLHRFLLTMQQFG